MNIEFPEVIPYVQIYVVEESFRKTFGNFRNINVP